MNDPRWKEREDAIVRNIMSGNNACGTLATAFQKGTLEDFLRLCVRGTLQICAGEAWELAEQRDKALRESEARRLVLAEVAANVHIAGELFDKVERAARVTA